MTMQKSQGGIEIHKRQAIKYYKKIQEVETSCIFL